MLSEELLKQVAEEFALAMNESLPIPEQCQHQFSEEFERKMQRLLSAVPINTQQLFRVWHQQQIYQLLLYRPAK